MEEFIDKGGIAGYLNRNYKTKTIGKELTPHVQSGLKILGDSYNDAMWKARRGLLGPHALIGSHGIDIAGKLLDTLPDIPVDKAISHVAHKGLGIDKPLADIGGELGELAITRKGIKLIPKINVKYTERVPKNRRIEPSIEQVKVEVIPKNQKLLPQAQKNEAAITQVFDGPNFNQKLLQDTFRIDPSILNIVQTPEGPRQELYSITPPHSWEKPGMIQRAFDNHLTFGSTKEGLKFDYQALVNNPVFKDKYKRLVAVDISSTPSQMLPRGRRGDKTTTTAFDNLRREKLGLYEELYGPAMREKGILPKQINLDHRLTLVQSLGMYHNVNPGSKMWVDIQNIALDRGYRPGDAAPTGEYGEQLELVDPESHRVKTAYFNNLHGYGQDTDAGMRYWNGYHRDTGERRIDIMEKSHTNEIDRKRHLDIVRDYMDHIDRGAIILEDALSIWKAENMTGITPPMVLDTLMSIIVDPQWSTYTVDSLRPILEDILKDDIERIRTIEKTINIEKQIEEYRNVRQIQQDMGPEYLKELETELRNLKRVTSKDVRLRKLERELKKISEQGDFQLFKEPGDDDLLDMSSSEQLLNDIFPT